MTFDISWSQFTDAVAMETRLLSDIQRARDMKKFFLRDFPVKMVGEKR